MQEVRVDSKSSVHSLAQSVQADTTVVPELGHCYYYLIVPPLTAM